MAAGKRDHVFVPIDSERFYLFWKIPQANNIRLHRQHFLFYIQEYFRQRLPGKAATSQTDKIIAAENIQHRCAVVHCVAFDRQRLLLRFIAAQNEKQIVAILLIQVLQAVLFIARWSEETTITVSLNHGDALILLINSAMFSWLQLTALKDWLGLPS